MGDWSRALFISLIALAGCQAQPSARAEGVPDISAAAKAVDDANEISRLRYQLGEANKRFAYCKDRWQKRTSDQEMVLRAERRLREVVVSKRPDMIENGEYALDEERAERRRMEMDQSYKSLDVMDCFG